MDGTWKNLRSMHKNCLRSLHVCCGRVGCTPSAFFRNQAGRTLLMRHTS